jgi:hypothetical protein
MQFRALARWPSVSLLLVACGSPSSPTPLSNEASSDAPSSDGAQPVEGGALLDSSLDAAWADGGLAASDASGLDVVSDARATDSGFVLGAPITAPAGQWTWVPFDNAFCANGTTTGIGINPSTTSTRVLIYMEGGGACWDELTCYTLMTAARFTTGYDQTTFKTELADPTNITMPGGFLDRAAAGNPVKDYSYVYIPYCTGDVFSGNNVTTIGTNTVHFVGYANVTAFLERIVPTFPGADRVILAGSSAGGYGAVFNWWQAQRAFGSVRVDVLDDSGAFMPADVLTSSTSQSVMSAQAASWNLAATVPCGGCMSNPSAIFGAYAAAAPTHRGALMSYTQDTVLPSYYQISTTQFTTGLYEDLATQFARNANLKAFVVGDAGHVLLDEPLLTQNGVTVQAFVKELVTDSPSWATVQP